MPEPVQIPISSQGMVNALIHQRNTLANENATLLARVSDLERGLHEATDRISTLEADPAAATMTE
jgi:cell division septum initiation protein DivIVA